jgi:lipoprotein NlpD
VSGIFKKIFVSAAAGLILCASGCATVRKTAVTEKPAAAKQSIGLRHKVKRGETLWRISRIYGVDVDSIADANNIRDARQLEVGQTLVIPGGVRSMSFAGIPGEDFSWPVKGSVISSFGQTFNDSVNKGVDILPRGDKDVTASRSGTVVFYNDDFLNFGKTLIIDHGDGFFTVYARNAGVFVKPGDVVQRGSKIAEAGARGIADKGYVHFEIRKGAVSQNPNFYLAN